MQLVEDPDVSDAVRVVVSTHYWLLPSGSTALARSLSLPGQSGLGHACWIPIVPRFLSSPPGRVEGVKVDPANTIWVPQSGHTPSIRRTLPAI